MRVPALLFLGVLAVAAAPAPLRAATVAPPLAQAAPSPNIIEVDRRCGPGRHWIARHRNRAGHWIRGHCSRRH